MQVLLNSNGFYTGACSEFGTIEGGIDVYSLPRDYSEDKQKFCKQVTSNNITTWNFYEIEYNEWLVSHVVVPTTDEKITSLETENLNLKTDIKSTKEVLQMLLFGEI